jgi:hypothetical protein
LLDSLGEGGGGVNNRAAHAHGGLSIRARQSRALSTDAFERSAGTGVWTPLNADVGRANNNRNSYTGVGIASANARGASGAGRGRGGVGRGRGGRARRSYDGNGTSPGSTSETSATPLASPSASSAASSLPPLAADLHAAARRSISRGISGARGRRHSSYDDVSGVDDDDDDKLSSASAAGDITPAGSKRSRRVSGIDSDFDATPVAAAVGFTSGRRGRGGRTSVTRSNGQSAALAELSPDQHTDVDSLSTSSPYNELAGAGTFTYSVIYGDVRCFCHT